MEKVWPIGDGEVSPPGRPLATSVYHDDLRGAQFDFEKQFEELAASKDLFLVTDFDELGRQPLLADKLTSNYLVIAEDEGYVIFDLHSTVP